VCRLALLYALADKSGEIKPAHLEAALAVWGYVRESARRLFGNPSYGGEPLDGGEPSHVKLLAFIKSRTTEGIIKRDAHRLFHNMRKGEDLNADFQILLSCGLIAEHCGRWYDKEVAPKDGPTGVCGSTDDGPPNEPNTEQVDDGPDGVRCSGVRDCNTGMTPTPTNNTTPVEPTTERGFL
jgi:hypothetical protein